MDTNKNLRSFTLIELLVVLALVAILSVVVILTLNPAELIKQARDSNRLSDLTTINTALNLFSADVTSGFMGTSTVVYVSIPDNASSACGSLGLPALPTGYNYNCVPTANLRNTDGTGWIPVNFQRISSNSPISQLPIDPQNTTSTKYYTYVTGGSWQLATKMESAKYQATTYSSGGADPSIYTIGNNLSLAPFVGGLVGWWNFEEGPNATSTDYSGFGNGGTWNGTSTQSQHYIAGRVGRYAGYFNGSSDYINIGTGQGIFNNATEMSYCFWANPYAGRAQFISRARPIGIFSGSTDLYVYYWNSSNVMFSMHKGLHDINSWSHYCFVTIPDKISFYKNGALNQEQTLSNFGVVGSQSYASYLGGNAVDRFLNGAMDDIRIYKRGISAAEVLALYDATR